MLLVLKITTLAVIFSTNSMAVKDENGEKLKYKLTHCPVKCVEGLMDKCDFTIKNLKDGQHMTIEGCAKGDIEEAIQTVSSGCKGCTIGPVRRSLDK